MAEDEARQKAEARRQRILDKAENRIDAISGIHRGDDEEDEKPRSTGASRMAAARRRRFQKKKESKDTPKEEEKAQEKAVATKSDEKAQETVTKAKEEQEESPPKETETTTDSVAAAEVPKRKYVGVAGIRRRKVMEQRQKEQEKQQQEEQEDDVVLKKKKKKANVSRLPILLHGLIVLLLFVAGLEVGLQQEMAIGTNVQLELAPRQGLKLFTGTRIHGKPTTSLLDDNNDNEQPEEVTAAEEDEFAVPEESKDANLDPLFGVDLDALTEGPGLFNAVGRFAVGCHRMVLSMVYYGPKNLLSSLMFSSPPLLMLVALVIRQFLGKFVFGARLPKDEDAKDSKDVLSMAKQFIKNFVGQAFPTAVTLYQAFNQLRADMYIVLAGLVVGITWKHSSLVDESPVISEVTDEL